MANTPSDTILTRLKGLRAQMREDELPLFSIPAIWENATDHQSNACDLVLTNQRLFGYIYTTFPRERLFLDALELAAITAVSIRQKNFNAMFRELLVSDNKKRIYIRATGKKIEETYTALRGAIAEHTPPISPTLAASTPDYQPGESADTRSTTTGNGSTLQTNQLDESLAQSELAGNGPTYSRHQIRQPWERSPLGITVLLVGGLILEIVGVLAWTVFASSQIGIPFILTGLLAVVVATIARRQLR